MILICYDGSPDAKAAIERGAHLVRDPQAVVLTVWQPFMEMFARVAGGGFEIPPSAVDVEQMDSANREHAERTAREGADLATAAGLEAKSQARERKTTIAAAVLEEAAAWHADAIVLGSRGLTGVKSVLLGSVSHAVLHHADRPVIIVPSGRDE